MGQPNPATYLTCPHCGRRSEPELRWCPHRQGLHLGAYCKGCTRWLIWVPQTPLWLALAPERPEDLLRP